MTKPETPHQEKNEFKDNDLVCYFFQHTKKEIENNQIDNDRSIILEKIGWEKKTGGCDCARKNPKGRCYLADFRQVVDRLRKRMASNAINRMLKSMPF
jgi:hypothetical protein